MLDLDSLDPNKVYTVYYVSKGPKGFPVNKEFFLKHDGTNYVPWEIRDKPWGAYFGSAHNDSMTSKFSLYPVVPEDLTTDLELNAAADLDGEPDAELLSKDMYEVPTSLRERLC